MLNVIAFYTYFVQNLWSNAMYFMKTIMFTHLRKAKDLCLTMADNVPSEELEALKKELLPRRETVQS